MSTTSVFWSLVRHELSSTGNRRKSNRTVAREWWMIYMLVAAAAGLAAMLYFALNHQLHLPYIWYATLGAPYMMVMFGVNGIKREWDNETQGWWLTLPYPRSWLVTAKWLAGIIRALKVMGAVFVAGTAFAMLIGFTISGYSLADVESFVVVGLNWLLPLAGFSPLLMAMGMLLAATPYTRLRPLSPLLWFVFMSVCSLFYQNFEGFGFRGIVDQAASTAPGLLPYPWEILAIIAAGWAIAGAFIGLIVHLLHKKLSF